MDSKRNNSGTSNYTKRNKTKSNKTDSNQAPRKPKPADNIIEPALHQALVISTAQVSSSSNSRFSPSAEQVTKLNNILFGLPKGTPIKEFDRVIREIFPQLPDNYFEKGQPGNGYNAYLQHNRVAPLYNITEPALRDVMLNYALTQKGSNFRPTEKQVEDLNKLLPTLDKLDFDKFYDGISKIFKSIPIEKIELLPAFQGRYRIAPLYGILDPTLQSALLDYANHKQTFKPSEQLVDVLNHYSEVFVEQLKNNKAELLKKIATTPVKKLKKEYKALIKLHDEKDRANLEANRGAKGKKEESEHNDQAPEERKESGTQEDPTRSQLINEESGKKSEGTTSTDSEAEKNQGTTDSEEEDDGLSIAQLEAAISEDEAKLRREEALELAIVGLEASIEEIELAIEIPNEGETPDEDVDLENLEKAENYKNLVKQLKANKEVVLAKIADAEQLEPDSFNPLQYIERQIETILGTSGVEQIAALTNLGLPTDNQENFDDSPLHSEGENDEAALTTSSNQPQSVVDSTTGENSEADTAEGNLGAVVGTGKQPELNWDEVNQAMTSLNNVVEADLATTLTRKDADEDSDEEDDETLDTFNAINSGQHIRAGNNNAPADTNADAAGGTEQNNLGADDGTAEDHSGEEEEEPPPSYEEQGRFPANRPRTAEEAVREEELTQVNAEIADLNRQLEGLGGGPFVAPGGAGVPVEEVPVPVVPEDVPVHEGAGGAGPEGAGGAGVPVEEVPVPVVPEDVPVHEGAGGAGAGVPEVPGEGGEDGAPAPIRAGGEGEVPEPEAAAHVDPVPEEVEAPGERLAIDKRGFRYLGLILNNINEKIYENLISAADTQIGNEADDIAPVGPISNLERIQQRLKSAKDDLKEFQNYRKSPNCENKDQYPDPKKLIEDIEALLRRYENGIAHLKNKDKVFTRRITSIGSSAESEEIKQSFNDTSVLSLKEASQLVKSYVDDLERNYPADAATREHTTLTAFSMERGERIKPTVKTIESNAKIIITQAHQTVTKSIESPSHARVQVYAPSQKIKEIRRAPNYPEGIFVLGPKIPNLKIFDEHVYPSMVRMTSISGNISGPMRFKKGGFPDNFVLAHMIYYQFKTGKKFVPPSKMGSETCLIPEGYTGETPTDAQVRLFAEQWFSLHPEDVGHPKYSVLDKKVQAPEKIIEPRPSEPTGVTRIPVLRPEEGALPPPDLPPPPPLAADDAGAAADDAAGRRPADVPAPEDAAGHHPADAPAPEDAAGHRPADVPAPEEGGDRADLPAPPPPGPPRP